MSLNRMIGVYRKTIKKVPGVHLLLYAVGERMVIPLLEKALRFQTPPDDPLNFRLKLLLRQWEPESVAFFKEVVRPGDRILDIGAHVGYYTRLFAELVGPTGKVVGVEPHPLNFRLLKANIQKYGNVTLLNVAAADREGEAILYDAFDNTGGSSLRLFRERRDFLSKVADRELSKRIQKGLPVRQYTVRAVPLDEALSGESFRVAKIDIEGAEPLALQGMPKILEALEILVFEFERGNLSTFNYKPRDLIKLIQDAGLQNFYLLHASFPQEVSPSELIQLGETISLTSYVNVAATRYPL